MANSFTKHQLEAINTIGSNAIISAGAGSGKTEVLTQRIFKLITEHNVRIDQILVVTFMEAAAHEMKERTRKSLFDNPKTRHLAAEIENALFMTIDAFNLHLVKRFHFLLNIGQEVRLIDENTSNIERRRIINEIFERKYADDDPNFIRLISRYCLRDDDDIKVYLDLMATKLAKMTNPQEVIDNIFLDNGIGSVKQTESFFDTSFERYYKMVVADIDDLSIDIRSFIGSEDNDAAVKMLDLISQIKDYDSLVTSLQLINETESKKLGSKIKKKLTNINENVIYPNIEAAKQEFTVQRDDLRELLAIYQEAETKLRAIKYQRNTFTFDDVAQLAAALVRKEEVVAQLKNEIKHILIDEYQDTSDIQDNLMARISDNNLFMVGDIKQSIYRFRYANPALFAEKDAQYSIKNGGIRIPLNENFRSREEVLDAINSMYSEVMTADIGGADYKSTQVINFGNKSYNDIGKVNEESGLFIYEYSASEEIPLNDHEREAHIIAQDIKRRMENKTEIFIAKTKQVKTADYRDFAIISSTNTPFSHYKKVFASYQIPLQVSDKFEATTDDVIIAYQSLVRLYNLIANEVVPSDENLKFNFVSVARSFLFELSDKEIYECVTNNLISNNTIYQKLDELAKANNQLPLDEQILALLTAVDFEVGIVKIGNVKFRRSLLEVFVNQVKEFTAIGYTLNEYATYFDILKENRIDIEVQTKEKDINAVKLLNIHKSKGLEYPIVYLINNNASFFTRGKGSGNWTFDRENGFMLPRIGKGKGKTYRHLLSQEKEKLEVVSEKIRLFYVAMTRAKEKLIVLKKRPKKENIIASIEDAKKFADLLTYWTGSSRYTQAIELTKPGLSKERTIVERKYGTSKKVELRSYAGDFSKQLVSVRPSKTSSLPSDDNLLALGERLHAYAEAIDFHTRTLPPIDDDNERIMMEKVINLPLFSDIDRARIYQEYAFYDEENNVSGVIDGFIIKEKEIILFDYKLYHLKAEQYQKQLAAYKRYLTRTFAKPVRAYLVSLIKGEYQEVTFDE